MLMPVLIACLPTSLFLRLAHCVLVVISFLGFGGGVMLARLVVSNCDNNVTAWFGAAMYSSCDVESRSELPPCSGETSSSCMSISKS